MSSIKLQWSEVDLYQTAPSPSIVKLKFNGHEFWFTPEDFKVFVAWLNAENENKIKLEKDLLK